MDFNLGGKTVGEEVMLSEPDARVPFQASLRSLVPVDHWEIACNGRVVRPLSLEGDRTHGEVSGTLDLEESGWCVLRAWSEGPRHPVLDAYPYATTSPIYVTVGGKKPRSPADAAYFTAWIDRIRDSVEAFTDWNTEEEKKAVEAMLHRARAVYEEQQQ